MFKNILLCLLFAFIVLYFYPLEVIMFIVVLGTFTLLFRASEALFKWNYKLGNFIYGSGCLLGLITFRNDYIVFYVFLTAIFLLIIELIWFQEKVVIKISQNNKNSV